jgi:hypothetical protein
VILGLIFAVVMLFVGVGQVITAEATYIPPVSGVMKDLLHTADFIILIMVAVVAIGVIVGAVRFCLGRS